MREVRPARAGGRVRHDTGGGRTRPPRRRGPPPPVEGEMKILLRAITTVVYDACRYRTGSAPENDAKALDTGHPDRGRSSCHGRTADTEEGVWKSGSWMRAARREVGTSSQS